MTSLTPDEAERRAAMQMSDHDDFEGENFTSPPIGVLVVIFVLAGIFLLGLASAGTIVVYTLYILLKYSGLI